MISLDQEKQTFPKTARIRKSNEYKDLWKKGRKFYTPHFIFILKSGAYPARLGVTVSRKVGNAVTRNRVKRIIRECFRQRQNRLGNRDISVIARNSAGTLSNKALMNHLEFHLDQKCRGEESA